MLLIFTHICVRFTNIICIVCTECVRAWGRAHKRFNPVSSSLMNHSSACFQNQPSKGNFDRARSSPWFSISLLIFLRR